MTRQTKEERNARIKIYNENNKDKIKAYRVRYYREHYETLAAKAKIYRKNHPRELTLEELEKHSEYWAKYYPEHAEEIKEKARARNKEHKEEYRQKRLPKMEHILAVHRAYKNNLKKDVFNHYGGIICACCGETHIEFLSIDHMNGGGNKHKKITGGSGNATYRWLKRNNYPAGFQVLCHNCNQAKHIYKICPHKNFVYDMDYQI